MFMAKTIGVIHQAGTLAAGAALAVSTLAAAPAIAQSDDISIIAVSHGQASDSFWSILKNGITKGWRGSGGVG